MTLNRYDSPSDRCTNRIGTMYRDVFSTQEGTAKYVDSTATMSVTLGRKFRHKGSRDQHKAVSSRRTKTSLIELTVAFYRP